MGAPKLGAVTLESFLAHLMGKIDSSLSSEKRKKKSMNEEIRTLEFWRAIIAECLATFFYVFLVCCVYISWTGSLIAHQPNWIVMSFTSGLAMATLSQCFGHISGAHVNPAVTCALLVTRKITPLRALLYVVAQCGGSIAGAALLYGVSVPGHQGALGISMAHEALTAWQIFGVEFVTTFLVVFTIFATLDPNRRSLGSDSLAIGIAYLVCSLSGLPASGGSMNPARTLGPAFVMNRWRHHWVYWLGPITGGLLAGLIYEFIFDTKKMGKTIRDTFDELERESNPEDHYEEPEPKMSNKGMIPFSTSGSGHSTSGSSSGSSGHQSNLTGYTSVQSANGHGPGPYDNYRAVPTYSPSPSATFQHTVITHDGIYVTGSGPNGQVHQPHHVATLPANSYHHLNSTYGAGIYSRGGQHNTLRQLPARMEYGSSGSPAPIAAPPLSLPVGHNQSAKF